MIRGPRCGKKSGPQEFVRYFPDEMSEIFCVLDTSGTTSEGSFSLHCAAVLHNRAGYSGREASCGAADRVSVKLSGVHAPFFCL